MFKDGDLDGMYSVTIGIALAIGAGLIAIGVIIGAYFF